MEFKSGEWADVPSVPQPQVVQPIVQKLSVVIPFIASEIEDVSNILRRSYDLSGQIQRNLFLVPFKGLQPIIMEEAQKAFASVGTISDAEGIESDWQAGAPMRSAAGPNSLFRQTAWFFYLNKRFAAWLWLEPDCIPITHDWLYALEREYFDVGRPFMGVKMTFPNAKPEEKRDYMNGVGIYPWNAVQYAPLIVQSTMWKQFPDIEAGFDVAGGQDVLNKAHLTRKIQLELSKREFVLRPETVLVHGRVNLNPVHVPADQSQPRIRQETDRPADVKSKESSEVRESTKHPVDNQDSRSGIQKLSSETVNSDGDVDTITGVMGSPVGVVESPVREHSQESNGAPSQAKQSDSEYGALSTNIRRIINELVEVWNDSPSRKVLIVKELRKAKLVPKHFR